MDRRSSGSRIVGSLANAWPTTCSPAAQAQGARAGGWESLSGADTASSADQAGEQLDSG